MRNLRPSVSSLPLSCRSPALRASGPPSEAPCRVSVSPSSGRVRTWGCAIPGAPGAIDRTATHNPSLADRMRRRGGPRLNEAPSGTDPDRADHCAPIRQTLAGEVGGLYRFAMARLGHKAHMAEDVVQQALLIAIAHASPPPEVQRQRAWLLGIVLRQLHGIGRLQRRERGGPLRAGIVNAVDRLGRRRHRCRWKRRRRGLPAAARRVGAVPGAMRAGVPGGRRACRRRLQRQRARPAGAARRLGLRGVLRRHHGPRRRGRIFRL